MQEELKYTALKKQLAFKSQAGLTKSGTHAGIEYAHILSDEDAATGAAYFCYKNKPEWEALQSWAKLDRGSKINFASNGLKNILRSEHIPYNIFYPLEKLRLQQPQLLNRLLESLFDGAIKVDKVERIKVEFAADVDKRELLNDSTSFDTYIEYRSGDDLCGIGIEVKYTEKSYPYGDTEKKRMFDENSEYNLLTKRCGYYKQDAHLQLRELNLKQPWRNHLLGIKLVEKGILKKFHSVLLYPKGNTYQAEVCKAYLSCLVSDFKNTFLDLTYEDFISKAEAVLSTTEDNDWLTYFKNRY